MLLARRRGRLRLPHPPLHQGATAQEGTARADPGRPRRPGTSPPTPADPDLPRRAQQQARHPRGTRSSARRSAPGCASARNFAEALRTARKVEAHTPHCRVIFTVHEMKRLARDAAELTALADHLTAHGLIPETLAGPQPGIYDPTGTGKLQFAFFSAMAETERENIRESTLEGLDTAARKGKHGGRLPVITDDMLHTVLRRRALSESVEQIHPDLRTPTGKRKGQTHSVASIYRALAEHAKREAHPEAIAQTHPDFAALTGPEVPEPRRETKA
nr:recombinase family protein [Streptomyces solaniscabiei]